MMRLGSQKFTRMSGSERGALCTPEMLKSGAGTGLGPLTGFFFSSASSLPGLPGRRSG